MRTLVVFAGSRGRLLLGQALCKGCGGTFTKSFLASFRQIKGSTVMLTLSLSAPPGFILVDLPIDASDRSTKR